MKAQSAPTIRRGAQVVEVDLGHMVGPDPHRPGPARGRLIAEQIPVWAIIGQLRALAGTTEAGTIDPAAISEVARDYGISDAAMAAALSYYKRHRSAIDALLEANAAALA